MPPSVNEGRMRAGIARCGGRSVRASSNERAKPERGRLSPMRSMACLNSSRSSAFLMAGILAPISSTPKRSRVPFSASATARFSAVWPPSVGSSASGRSRSMILATNSGVSGST